MWLRLADFKHQLRLERPFDMDVQLGFGQGLDKLFDIHIFSVFGLYLILRPSETFQTAFG